MSEYASNGQLFDFVEAAQGLSEPMTRTIFTQILSAVEYLHGKGFVHRDVKMENILLDSACNVKLADFGLAKQFSVQPQL